MGYHSTIIWLGAGQSEWGMQRPHPSPSCLSLLSLPLLLMPLSLGNQSINPLRGSGSLPMGSSQSSPWPGLDEWGFCTPSPVFFFFSTKTRSKVGVEVRSSIPIRSCWGGLDRTVGFHDASASWKPINYDRRRTKPSGLLHLQGVRAPWQLFFVLGLAGAMQRWHQPAWPGPGLTFGELCV